MRKPWFAAIVVAGAIAVALVVALSSASPDDDQAKAPPGDVPVSSSSTPDRRPSTPDIEASPAGRTPAAEPSFTIPPTPIGPPTFAAGTTPSAALPSATPPPVSQPTPGPSPTLAPGTQAVPAPIDGLDVRVLESFPPQYVLNVKAGLPSGCARRYTSNVVRDGSTFKVTVLNTLPTGQVACTQIYGMYELNINLPGPFISGQTYTVQVNDKSTTFTAQ